MVRAGLIRQVGSGLWSWLPAGWRVHQRIVQIVREEMDAIGGQEMLMPVLHPAELWRRTGRYEIEELFKLKDRRGADMVLAMTHEEIVTTHAAADDPLLPRPAADPLPLPGQGARRAAAARRRAAHARVHHEGRLHASTATREGLDVAYDKHVVGLRPDLRPLRARVVPRRRPTSG